MNITTSSPSYPMRETQTPISVASTSSPAEASAAQSDDMSAPPDRVTISREALERLVAENAAYDDPNAPVENAPVDMPPRPSDGKMFVYGVLGLERPDKKDSTPEDDYTYGRYLAAAVTVGSMAALL